MKIKLEQLAIGFVALIIIIGISWYFLMGGNLSNISGSNLGGTGIEVTLRDANGNIIESGVPFSVVGGTPGVYYMDFKTSVRNTGSLPLTTGILSASPQPLQNAYAGFSQQSNPVGGFVVFDTAKPCVTNADCGSTSVCLNISQPVCSIPTGQLEVMVQPVTFSVNAESTFVCPTGQTCETSSGSIQGGQSGAIQGTSSLQLRVLSDPVTGAAQQVNLISSTGTGESGTGSCLSSNTICNPTEGGCCSGNCLSTSQSTNNAITCTQFTSGATYCNTVNNEVYSSGTVAFTCPSGSTSCELRESGDDITASDLTCQAPYTDSILRSSCTAGTSCSYKPADTRCFIGVQTTTSVTYKCA